MIKHVEVFLWGSRIGILSEQKNGNITFEYDKEFQRSGIEVSPIKMPLSDKVYGFPELNGLDAFHGLPGLVADSLPDKYGNALIDAWLISQGRDPDTFTPLERLCYTGTRGMGALEYKPAFPMEEITADLDVTEMTKFAADVLSKRQSALITGDAFKKAQLLEIGSSAGGARAKAVIAWNEQTGQIRSGQINAGDGFEYWLMKFDGVSGNGDHEIADPRQYSKIEFAYHLMATDLKIKMNECRLLEKDGLIHFMTKRFDRENGQKLHMQTLAALCHVDYNTPRIYSYEQLSHVMRKLNLSQPEMKQMFRRIAFADIGMNFDDHVKNISFLMDKSGKWQLSPAYDITFSYKPGNKWIGSHQMLINGKTEHITDEDLIACGKAFGLSKKFCIQTIIETKRVVSNWLNYAEKAGISEERTNEVSVKLDVPTLKKQLQIQIPKD